MFNNNPITQLTPITVLAPDDVLPIVDVSDRLESPVGTTKKVTMLQILDYVVDAFPWITVTSSPVTLVPNQGYIVDGASLIIFNLPTTAAVGDQYYIEGLSTHLFQVHQAAGQQILFGNSQTTIGTGGRLDSLNRGDSLILMCVVANTTFKVRNVGNFEAI